ncbi:DNA/RNA helicase domain-containing protein, partial [Acetobacter oeni]
MIHENIQIKNTISETNNSIRKLSPFRLLTESQTKLVKDIVNFCEHHIRDNHAALVIEGDAGTGKSLALNTAFTRIQTEARQEKNSPLYETQNILLVNHPEMIKLYRNISTNISALRRKDYERPTTFINTAQKSD